MTKPTQAQEALERLWSFYQHLCARRTLGPENEKRFKESLDLLAAAGATFDDGYKYKKAECYDEIAATIERCAKVAECTTYMSGAAIAAAIRKLKDEP